MARGTKLQPPLLASQLIFQCAADDDPVRQFSKPLVIVLSGCSGDSRHVVSYINDRARGNE
jgi:hypothetical protein